MKKKVVAIIPARYQSSRFPGKPLIDIGGQSMISRVYRQAKRSPLLAEVVVATDDVRILEHLQAENCKAVMTGEHISGTNRCAEALSLLNDEYDIVVNIQGDEPFFQVPQIAEILAAFDDKNTAASIATLIRPRQNPADWHSPHVVKALVGTMGNALYFSRRPLPYVVANGGTAPVENAGFYQHIGIYAFKTEVLRQVVQLAPAPLSQAESLEQLTWLENGYPIKCCITHYDNIAIDTPEDLLKIRHLL